MKKSQVTTHEILEQMSPRANREDFAQRVVTDYETLPTGYLERLQADMDATISRHEATRPSA